MSIISCGPLEESEAPLHPGQKDVSKIVRQLTDGFHAHLTTPNETPESSFDVDAIADATTRFKRTQSGAAPRVAILLSGTRGDHQPSIPLSLGLQERGMQVKVFAKTTFQPMYDKFGIEMVGLPGVDYEQIFTDPSVRSGLASGQPMLTNLAINHILETTYDENGCLDTIIEGLKEFRPSLVLWHMTQVVEAIVAWKLFKCPCVCMAMFPYAPTKHIPCFPLTPKWTGAFVGSFGVKKSHSTLWKNLYLLGKGKMKRHVWNTYKVAISGRDLYARYGSPKYPMICAWSPALGPRPDDYHEGVVGPVGFFRLSEEAQASHFTLPDGLEDFVKGVPRDQLAYISWGSMGSGSDEGLTKLAVGALKVAGAKGVVQGGYSDLQLDKLKDSDLKTYASENVYFIPKGASIPHNWLFPLCGVCVHHGGIGTLAACLYAGTPSVVTPVFVDQFYWATRTQENGTGLYGPYLASASKRKLGACVKTCLDDLRSGGEMASKAKELGEKMKAEDGVSKAVKYLENLIPDGTMSFFMRSPAQTVDTVDSTN